MDEKATLESFRRLRTRQLHEGKIRSLFRDIKEAGNFTDEQVRVIIDSVVYDIYKRNEQTKDTYRFRINNGKEHKYVTEREFEEYKAHGWVLGSIKTKKE